MRVHVKKKVFINEEETLQAWRDSGGTLTVDELVEMTGACDETVRKWLHRHNLPLLKKRKKRAFETQLDQDVHDADAMGISYGQFKMRYPSGLHRVR